MYIPLIAKLKAPACFIVLLTLFPLGIHAQTGDYWASCESCANVTFYEATPEAAATRSCHYFSHSGVAACQNDPGCSVEFTGIELISDPSSNPRTYLCTWYRTFDPDHTANDGPLGTGTSTRRYQYDCSSLENGELDFATGQCVDAPPRKPLGCPFDAGTGNPCNVATGNKFQSEVDFSSGGLSLTRYYNSSALKNERFGRGWRHSFLKGLYVQGDLINYTNGTGRGERWLKVNGTWQGDADSKVLIIENAADFVLTTSNGATETYDLNGRLQATTDTNGHQTVYTYDASLNLLTVTNHYGATITFSYKSGKVDTVTDSAGQVYYYEFDANYNLVTVIYPDETPAIDTDNPRRNYHYENTDFPNHLTGITDENGDRYATWAYDSNGKAILSEHAQTTNAVAQETFDISYLSSTEAQVSDAVGTHQTWTFQDILGAKKLTGKLYQADGKGITQTWDANGNKLTRTDAEGRVTSYTYNATNQKVTMTEAFGTPQARTTTYEYVSADVDLVTKVISPSIYATNNKEIVTAYDANQNVTAVTINGFDAQGNAVTRVTSFAHDAFGKVTQIDGPRTDVSDITSMEYYDCTTGAECGQLKKVTNALGHETTYDAYDAAGRLLQMTDANGMVTSYSYHPRGWLLTSTQTPSIGSARVTNYVYDNVGQLIAVVAPDGSQQNYEYDASHALRKISDNLGNTVEYLYDAKGNRTDEFVKDPGGTLVRSTSTTYDMRNFVSSVNAGGSVTQMVNDAVGNVTAQTDPNNNPSTTHNYDALYRLTSTLDALTNTSGYTYNVADQLIQVVAPNGATTQYEYDDLGNQTKEVSPDRGTRTYTHDAAGNVIGMTDARNVTSDYSYDALNRLIAVDYAGTDEDVIYQYDAPVNPANTCGVSIGRLCEQTDQSGERTFTYDAFGNVVRVEHDVLGTSFTWQYAYDDNNRLLDTMYPNGRVVSITRDAIGRLTDMTTTVNAQVTNVISNRTYRGDGVLREQVLGNGLWDSREHDLQGRLAEQTNAGTLPKLLSYDDNGNILTIDDEAGTRSFTYDPLDRLTSAGIPNVNLGYGYDANGNRTSRTENSVSTLLSYTANSNRLISNDSTAVTSDAAGNTLIDQAGNREFEYNQAGRMSKVSISAAEVARYEYDANGLRVKKITPTRTTIYQYCLDGKLLAESNTSGKLSREYLYADGELVAVIEAEEGTPLVTAPADITIEATAVLTPVSLGTATAVDQNGNSLTVTPDNTGPFAVGQTTVIWSTLAGNGITGAAAQNVLVVDTIAPNINAPADMVVQSSGTTTAVAIGQAVATDIFGVTITNDAPQLFQEGVTNVLWTAIDGNGNATTATQVITVTPAVIGAMISPSPGSTFASGAQTFTWQADPSVDEWWIYVGDNVGGKNIVDSSFGLSTSATLSNLPQDGRTLYVMLWHRKGSTWESESHVYTAASTSNILSPIPGAKLDAGAQTFSWQANSSVDEWWIYVGDNVGEKNIVDSSFGLSTSATLSNLPQDGRTLYVMLWHRKGSTWGSKSYIYTAAGTPKILSPIPGTKLDAGAQTFSWQADPSVDEWWIYVGYNVGEKNIVDSSFGLSTSATLSNLPQDGRTLYVMLWHRKGSTWQSESHVFTAAGGVTNTSGGQ